MNRVTPQIDARRSSILGFIVLVVGLSWLQFIPRCLESSSGVDPPAGLGVALSLIFVLSPTLAALVLLQRASGVHGVDFLRERFRWDVSPRWYGVALLTVPLIAGIAALIVGVTQQPIPLESIELLLLVQALLYGLVANLLENYGWRGYLQEGLQSDRSALFASVITGIVWGLWHLPLLAPGGSFDSIPIGLFFVVIIGESIIIGWLYNATHGSVLLAAIMHTSFNASVGVIVFGLVDMGESVGYFYGIVGIAVWILAIAIVWKSEPSHMGF